MRGLELLTMTLFGVGLVACGPAAAQTIHVRPGGAADGPGSADQPVDLTRAAALVRQRVAAGLPAGGIEVLLHAGTYELTASTEFGPTLSGQPGRPVVWRAAGDGEVRIVGGKVVRGWQPVTDPAILARLVPEAAGQVMVCDLPAIGVTDYGELAVRGFAKSMARAHLELFYKRQPMTLARWPNAPEFTTIADLPDGEKGLRFGYTGDRPQRWAAEPDLWVFAYFYHDWADVYQPLKNLDTANKIITLGEPKPNYGMRRGQRFYVLNCLAELDSPGEYYVDRATGKLYFWPPEPLADGDCEVSVAGDLLVLRDASHIELRGLTVEVCRGQAIAGSNVKNVRVVGCTLRNTGTRAGSLSGTESGFIGCDVYNNADGGLAITGGDRKTLTAAGMFAENNHIRDYSRWSRTYRPGISVNGVGNRVAHNLIHHGPHMGLGFGGNLNLIEFNEIHSVCYETGDVGAIYTGRDWTQRGNIIRHNYMHHVEGPGRLGAMGVYLDDQYSGTIIEGNVFYRVTRAAFIGGGCDNVTENNLFVDCNPAMHIDNRGMGWQKAATDDPNGELRTRLKAVDIANPPYSTRWPELVNILADDPGVPKRNKVLRNVSIRGRWDDIHKGTQHLQIIEGNTLDPTPGLLHPERIGDDKTPAAIDFALDPACPAFAAGFKALPLEQMGLVESPDRASWPVHHAPILKRLAAAPEPAAERRVTAQPTYRVERRAMPVTIDGTIDREEWLGAEATKAAVLAQTEQGRDAKPLSRCWLLWDDTALLVAFDNETSAIRRGATWGADDAVEIALSTHAPGNPITILRGYAGGTFTVERTPVDGAPLTAVPAAGVAFAVAVEGQKRWTAEWRIPWAALGLKPEEHPRLRANLTVRKPPENLWLMWRGTGGHSYNVPEAGVLELTK